MSVAHPLDRLLVLSVSAGAGHVRAAEAVCAHAEAAEVHAEHLDVMDFVPGFFRRIYVDAYLKLAGGYPMAWGALYGYMQRADRASAGQVIRREIERRCSRRLLEAITVRRPGAILCTHFLPAELLAHWRSIGALDCPVYVQVTDFDLHPMWVQAGMDGYFAANDEVAFHLQGAGVDAARTDVTGIPVMPAFGKSHDRAECARALGLDPARTTLLVMGGGAGMGRLDEIAARLLGIDGDFQLLVIAGRNAAALAALQQLAAHHPGRLVAQGFTREVERSMACADLVISKAGGLTVSEALAMGIPMILNSPLPGQEERNADYLLEQGAAMKAGDTGALEFRVRQLLAHPLQREAMRARARSLGRADAGKAVVARLVGRFAA